MWCACLLVANFLHSLLVKNIGKNGQYLAKIWIKCNSLLFGSPCTTLNLSREHPLRPAIANLAIPHSITVHCCWTQPSVWIAGGRGVGEVQLPQLFSQPRNTLLKIMYTGGQLYTVYIRFTSQFCLVSDHRKVQLAPQLIFHNSDTDSIANSNFIPKHTSQIIHYLENDAHG